MNVFVLPLTLPQQYTYAIGASRSTTATLITRATTITTLIMKIMIHFYYFLMLDMDLVRVYDISHNMVIDI